MRPLTPVDRLQIATTVLFVVLGLLILVRAGIRHAPLGSYVVGAAFLAYGLYRARFVARALWGRRPR